ncbi:MAG TPA: hypothetical protein VFE58_16410 [Tepidisphaeraceae bacterium]|jgi:TPR repeat protein|nr:hypothetical protein [Tepidisphaeraceae bacterium]
MRRLFKALLFSVLTCCMTAYAMSTTDSSSGAASQPASTEPGVRDLGWAADLDVLWENTYRYGDPPDAQVVERTLARARRHPDDPEFACWAARCVIRKWTGLPLAAGMDMLRTAAAAGYAPALGDFGFETVMQSRNDPGRIETGLRMLRRAVEAGDARAMYLLPVVTLGDVKVRRPDFDVITRLATKSAEKGYAPAHHLLAQIYDMQGEHAKALASYESAAAAGSVEAIRHMVDVTSGSVNKADQSKVQEYLLRGRVRRDPELSRILAAYILLGRTNLGVDRPLVVSLLRFAELNGDARAAALLARARLEGLWGIARQPERAYRELNSLASGIDASGSAAFLLGRCLVDGTAMKTDSDRGYTLIRHAANVGYAPAIHWSGPNKAGTTQAVGHRGTDQNPAATAPAGDPDQTFMGKFGDVVLDAARVDHDAPVAPPLGLGPVAPAGPLPEADQELEDADILRDGLLQTLPAPPAAACQRMICRARGPAPDPAALAWGALVVLDGETGHIETDEVSRNEAREWLKRAAEAGYPEAVAAYGNALVRGEGYPQDTLHGLKLLQAARDKGDPGASAYLSLVFLRGAPGMKPDTDGAVILMREAAQRGVTSADWLLAMEYGQRQQWQKMLESLRHGWLLLDERSCGYVGWLLTGEKRIADKDFNSPLIPSEVHTRGLLCENPFVEVSAVLSDPFEPDLVRLVLQRAAARGCIQGRAAFAGAQLSGKYGVKLDPIAGRITLEQLIAIDPSTLSDEFNAANARVGQCEAKWQLGILLFEGQAIERDPLRGRELIIQAAEGHNPRAMAWLKTQEISK